MPTPKYFGNKHFHDEAKPKGKERNKATNIKPKKKKRK